MILPDRILRAMTPAERKQLGKAGVLASEAQERAAHKNEAEMQNEIQRYCDLHGWPCYRSRTDKRSTGRVGTPDLLICLPFRRGVVPHGLFVAIECKMKGNKPTPEQNFELSKIAAAEGETLVAYSAKEAVDFLKQLAQEHV